jgi:Flp pilus assembly pilin Flp
MTRVSDNSSENESGQAAAEYSLILSLVVIVVLGTLTLFSDSVAALFDRVIDIWP